MGQRRDLLLDRRFLAALAVLVVNDRLLKGWLGAGVLGPVTGKLSDVAAMAVGPVLVAVLVSARPARWRALALLPPALALATINLSADAARRYESVLGAVTSVEHRIVVDPTDLLGLAGLIVGWRVLGRPRPVPLPGARAAAVAIGLVAVGAGAASSVAGSAGRDRVVVDGDRVVAVSPHGGGARVSDDDGVTWRSEADGAAGLDVERADPTTELCLRADPRTCVRLVGERTIEESGDGGATWDRAWRIDPGSEQWLAFGQHGFDGGGEPVRLADLAETPNGSVVVAATSMDPVRRGPDGDWSPSLGRLHRFQGWVFLPLVIAAVFLAIGSAAIGAAPMSSTTWSLGLLAVAGAALVGSGVLLALGYLVLLEVVTILIVLSLAPAVVALAVVVALLVRAGGASRWPLGRHLLAAVGVVALAALPHLAWSLGWGSWPTINTIAAALAVVAGLAAGITLGRDDRARLRSGSPAASSVLDGPG